MDRSAGGSGAAGQDPLGLLEQRLCLGQALDRALNLRVGVERGAVGGLLIEGAEVQLVTKLVAHPVAVGGELRVRKVYLLRSQISRQSCQRLLIRAPVLGQVGPQRAEVARAEMEERSRRDQPALKGIGSRGFVLFFGGDPDRKSPR